MLRQGEALTCILFNLASKKVVRDSEIKPKGTTNNRSTQVVAYSRDVLEVGRPWIRRRRQLTNSKWHR